MQDDSNSESTFEIVDSKKADSETYKSDAFSSRSSSASLLGVPMMSADSSLTPSPVFPTGNILSSVAPPSALPSFIAVQPSTSAAEPNLISSSQITQLSTHVSHTNALNIDNAFIPKSFSAAIPSAEPVQASVPASAPADNGVQSTGSTGSSIMGWVRGAVSSGGILHKVAEKAKSSVDTMITTLDPQMREFIYSGGDLDVIVASDKEVKISPVREAFQLVFGKATVVGLPAQCTSIAAQPVGFESAMTAAKERICVIRSDPRVGPDVPVVAVENYIEQIGSDKWFDISLVYITHPSRGVSLYCLSQATPLPPPIVTSARDDTPPAYKFKDSGFAVTIGSLMGTNLQVHHTEWHKALTGVSRREMILLASRSLAGLYKNALSVQD